MRDSITKTAIRIVSGNCLRPVLKTLGFTRKAPHFYRLSADVYHCIHFQASQWGTAVRGEFTINLAVTSPSLYRYWTSHPLPANPATALWPIQQRLGFLSPQRRDMWWHVDELTDAEVVGREIISLLCEFGMPFFDTFPDSDAILSTIRNSDTLPGVTASQCPLIEAMLLTDRSQTAEARDCIIRALTQNKVPVFKQTILAVAGRLGMGIDSADVGF